MLLSASNRRLGKSPLPVRRQAPQADENWALVVARLIA